VNNGKFVLAIDLGTSGCKAALVALDGTVHTWEFRPVDTLLPDGGGAEQDPAQWWCVITEACTAVVARGQVAADAIIAICANTQGEGTVPVDEKGTPLCNAILWMDTRGAAHIRQAVGGPISFSGYSVTKIFRFLQLTGGAPSLTGKDPAGHMLYLKHERPEIYQRTHKFLNVLDYVNFRLTGRMVATNDSLLTSWVTDNRVPGTVSLHAGLCASLGIPMSLIPSPVPCTEVLGEVDAAFATAVGISPKTPVVAGSIDNTAAAIGAGTTRDGDLHLYLGTSSWLAAHVSRKKTDIINAIAAVPCAVPGKYLMTALQATAGGNLSFLRDNVFYPQDELLRGETPGDFYAALDRLAAATPPGARGVLYTPWIYGERAPVEDHTIRAGLHNLSLEHTRADMLRAVLEGVALNTRWLLDPVEKFLGKPTASIAAVGGGADSPVWCQIHADILNRPVRQTANPIEANVRGSAFIAAAALGHIRFEDVPGLVRIQQVFEPRTALRPVYDLHFAEFKRLYRALSPVSKRLNTFHHGPEGAALKDLP
jgi:xylulokinase